MSNSPQGTQGTQRRTWLIRIAQVCFWVSVVKGLLGQIITFYPGASCDWYAVAAILAVPAVLVGKRRWRIAAVVLVAIWSIHAVKGYQRGREYREKLEASRELGQAQVRPSEGAVDRSDSQ